MNGFQTMDNKNVKGRTSGKYINWITVWGFIVACIAYNMYVDNRQKRLITNEYRSQYEIESQRADSLYKETVRLEQRLQQLETSTGQKLSTRQSVGPPTVSTAREL
ncbi:hypothetical protein [Spirosoma sp. 48-14]|uniref:hypothetical protein n=2 Tax=unclassified Spirosoma TaxID=2621999 RepID=UPI0009690B2F|nr:hypothetical protein [Spirosoma sp. 48-14]OJW72449.1 MAG: hypothetical protein BGO59_15065 [Spirosoma sp. 48-14]